MIYAVAVVDDEDNARAYVSALAERWARARGLEARIETFGSAEELLMKSDGIADILLLDVELGSMSGMALARRLREKDERTQIVFISGYPDYMPEGYEVEAVNYLVKPVDDKKLFQALDQAVRRLGKREEVLTLETDEGILRVKTEEILFAEAFGHSCAIRLRNGTVRLTSAISGLEKRLGDGFVRCHRSYIVNLKYVSRVARAEAILDDGSAVPISRKLHGDVSRRFIDYYLPERNK